jgi:choline dehydrogenase-like flavoprotein
MDKTPPPAIEPLNIIDASSLTSELALECDVAIVGTGAGGGTAAEVLALAGYKVLMIEEGPYKTARDFHGLEREAYGQLYQESANRASSDKGILILQGRCVGGGTTVNWTASFRTPEATLAQWVNAYGLADYTQSSLAPWFEKMEQRLSISTWEVEPNANNAVLMNGAQKLGIDWKRIPRNVKGCANSGQCGTGCPLNAKQSMLVTTIPAALGAGATLLHHARAERFELGERKEGTDGKVIGLTCTAMAGNGADAKRVAIRVKARHYISAAGGIGTPALLLRSNAPDPAVLLGKRTFLHPTVGAVAVFPGAINGAFGAPQSIYSDHFMHGAQVDGPAGYKLEVGPAYPMLVSSLLPGYGEQHAAMMRRYNNMNFMIALLRDGFHRDSNGGTVKLRADGSPELDYKVNDYLWEGYRRALATMAEIQFAAGAERVIPMHEDAAAGYASWAEAKQGIAGLKLTSPRVRFGCAHVMGGCMMGVDPARGVVDGDGTHWQLRNLSVMDASIFPTSIGANPQLSIYGITARNASRLAARLKG